MASGVLLLTNKECPWRCLMCDLWKETLTTSVPPGAIPRQIELARETWSRAGLLPRQVKLYNSGSFFDPAAIPPDDYPDIARGVAFADHVVVESHPRLVGDRTRRFRDLLEGSLEVALGLETAHPDILARLNKGFDLDDFARAAEALRADGIALRAFLLVPAPFLDEADGLDWAVRSARFAFDCGASVVSLIPLRTGNGAMERLLAAGELTLPSLGLLERAQREVLALGRGRVFADTWGLEALSTCRHCFDRRVHRLRTVNRTQRDVSAIVCPECGGS